MTEAMITDYMTRFGVDRTQAVKDLNDIEEGRGQPPATLPEGIYSNVLAAFRGRDTQSGGVRRLIIGSVAIGTVALAALAAVVSGNLRITGTLTVPSINVTSTGASITASGTISGVDGSFSGVVTATTMDVSGTFRAASGTAANPSVSFQGNSSTGLYVGSTGALNISTNGTNRLTISNGGTFNFVGNLLPATNNARDLGSGLVSWGSIYASTSFIGVDQFLTGFATGSSHGSVATSTWKINNRTALVLTGSSATTTLDLSSLDSCLVMKGSGTTTYIRINATASLVTSTTPCPTSP
jgi:hypothetical protein